MAIILQALLSVRCRDGWQQRCLMGGQLVLAFFWRASSISSWLLVLMPNWRLRPTTTCVAVDWGQQLHRGLPFVVPSVAAHACPLWLTAWWLLICQHVLDLHTPLSASPTTVYSQIPIIKSHSVFLWCLCSLTEPWLTQGGRKLEASVKSFFSKGLSFFQSLLLLKLLRASV